MKKLVFVLSFLTVVFFSRSAFPQTPHSPARCSYGNQDSSCATPLYSAWQAAPACSSDAGWTTVASAQWIGSRYTSPSCSYQAPPTCSTGQVQTQAPVWNGSSWVGLSCSPPPGGNPPTQAQQAACLAAMNSMGALGGPFSNLFMSGPKTGQGLDQYNIAVAPLMAMVNSGAYNLDIVRTSGTLPASGLNDLWVNGAGGDNAFCWITPGTLNVIAVQYMHDSSNNGGPN